MPHLLKKIQFLPSWNLWSGCKTQRYDKKNTYKESLPNPAWERLPGMFFGAVHAEKSLSDNKVKLRSVKQEGTS